MLSPGDRAEHCAIVSRPCSLSLRSRELGSLGCTSPSDAWAKAQPIGVHLQPIAKVRSLSCMCIATVASQACKV